MPTVSVNSSSIIQADDHVHLQQQQQPKVYYALATNDLLRQIKLNQTVYVDPPGRQQLVQTPSGLVLIQPQSQQNVQQAQARLSVSPVGTNQTDGASSERTLSGLIAVAANAQVSQLGTLKTGSTVLVDSSTFPRQSKVEHIQGSEGLICTCPPEVHQG